MSNANNASKKSEIDGYIQDGFLDFIRFNKKQRKKFASSAQSLLEIYNALIEYSQISNSNTEANNRLRKLNILKELLETECKGSNPNELTSLYTKLSQSITTQINNQKQQPSSRVVFMASEVCTYLEAIVSMLEKHKYDELAYTKRQEIKKLKSEVSVLAYDLLNKNLFHSQKLPLDHAKKLVTFVEQNGELTRYTFDKSVIPNLIKFYENSYRQLKKPRFAFFRRARLQKYYQRKVFLESEIDRLEKHYYNKNDILNLIEKNDQNTNFGKLLASYKEKNSETDTVEAEELLKFSKEHEVSCKNEIKLVENKPFFKRLFYKLRNGKSYTKTLVMQQYLKDFNKKTTFAIQPKKHTQIELVVGGEIKEKYIKRYNQATNNENQRLYTEDLNILLHERRKLSDTVIYDDFYNLLERYNKFITENKNNKSNSLKEIPTEGIINKYKNGWKNASDLLNRRKAYNELCKNKNNFKAFVDKYKQDTLNPGNNSPVNISDADREFINYLENVLAEVETSDPNFSDRIQRIIQTAYDKFGDHVVYHGKSQQEIKKAIRYVDVMLYSIEEWQNHKCNGVAPITIKNGLTLSNDQNRKEFIAALKLVRKIIHGDSLEKQTEINDNYTLTNECQQQLKHLIPDEKLNNNNKGISQQHIWFIDQYTPVHLQKQLQHCRKNQKDIEEEKENEKFIVEEYYNLIKKNSPANSHVNAKTGPLASEALDNLTELLFYQDEYQVLQSRIADDYFVSFESNSHQNNELNRTGSSWSYASINKYVIHLNLDEKTLKGFREKIKKYINKLATLDANSLLKVANYYADAYSIILTKEELISISKMIFAVIFSVDKNKITISKNIETFINNNRHVEFAGKRVESILHQSIADYIQETELPFNQTTADTIFKFGSKDNKEAYARKRMQELLNTAAMENERMGQKSKEDVSQFIQYIRAKDQNFQFENQQELSQLFKAYPVISLDTADRSENDSDFWREAVDMLACHYYTSNEGKNYIKGIRTNQIRYLLNKEDSIQLQEKAYENIRNFYKYIQQQPVIIQLNIDDVDNVFVQGFTGIVSEPDTRKKLHQLNKAELLALYFDVAGKYLDQARLEKMEEIFLGNITISDFFSSFPNDAVRRDYPGTDEGKQAFVKLLRTQFINEENDSGKISYDYKLNVGVNKIIGQLALEFDQDGELLDDIRLAEIITCKTLMGSQHNRITNYNFSQLADLTIVQLVRRIKNVRNQGLNKADKQLPINKYPLTETGRKRLNAYFEEMIINKQGDADIQTKYTYCGIIKYVALNFDADQRYLDKIQFANINLNMSSRVTKDEANAQYTELLHENTQNNKKAFPCHQETRDELQTLFLSYIYPHGLEEKNIRRRYGYCEAVEFFVLKFANQDIKEKCILARIADMFVTVDNDERISLSAAAAESYIASFAKENCFATLLNNLAIENVSELNAIISFFALQDKPWNPSIEALIKKFEPKTNKGQYLTAYRLKRFAELFDSKTFHHNNRIPFLPNNEYTELLNNDKRSGPSVSLNSLKSWFGLANSENHKEFIRIIKSYISDLSKLSEDDDVDIAMTLNSDIFQLALLMIPNGSFLDLDTPDDTGAQNAANENEQPGKKSSVQWQELCTKFYEISSIKAEIDEARVNMINGNFNEVYIQYSRQEQFSKNLDSNKHYNQRYKKIMLGISKTAIEICKEFLRYQDEISQIEKEIKELSKLVSKSTDLISVRIYVNQIIRKYSKIENANLRLALINQNKTHQQKLSICSDQLRLPSVALNQLEMTKKKNAITIQKLYHANDRNDDAELTSMFLAEDKNHELNSKITTFYQKYSKMEHLTTSDNTSDNDAINKDTIVSLQGELRASAINIAELFYDHLASISKRNLSSHIARYFPRLSQECENKLLQPQTSVVDSCITALKNMQQINNKNIANSILKVLKASNLIDPHEYDDLYKILKEVDEVTLGYLPKLIGDFNPGTNQKRISRANIPRAFVCLVKNLYRIDRNNKISDIKTACLMNKKHFLKDTPAQLLIDHLADVFLLKDYNINKDDLRAALKNVRTPFLSKLKNGAISDEDYITYLEKLFTLLIDAHYRNLNEIANNNLTHSKSAKEIKIVLQGINDTEELNALKSITSELANVDEKGYVKQMMADIQSKFFDKLSDEATIKAQAALVRVNANCINTMFHDLLDAMQSVPVQSLPAFKSHYFRVRLAHYNFNDFNNLRQGLDKQRLTQFRELLAKQIIREGKKIIYNNTETPYLKLLQQLSDYMQADNNNTLLSSAEFDKFLTVHKVFSENIMVFHQQLYWISKNNHNHFNPNTAAKAFNTILDLDNISTTDLQLMQELLNDKTISTNEKCATWREKVAKKLQRKDQTVKALLEQFNIKYRDVLSDNSSSSQHQHLDDDVIIAALVKQLQSEQKASECIVSALDNYLVFLKSRMQQSNDFNQLLLVGNKYIQQFGNENQKQDFKLLDALRQFDQIASSHKGFYDINTLYQSLLKADKSRMSDEDRRKFDKILNNAHSKLTMRLKNINQDIQLCVKILQVLGEITLSFQILQSKNSYHQLLPHLQTMFALFFNVDNTKRNILDQSAQESFDYVMNALANVYLYIQMDPEAFMPDHQQTIELIKKSRSQFLSQLENGPPSEGDDISGAARYAAAIANNKRISGRPSSYNPERFFVPASSSRGEKRDTIPGGDNKNNHIPQSSKHPAPTNG